MPKCKNQFPQFTPVPNKALGTQCLYSFEGCLLPVPNAVRLGTENNACKSLIQRSSQLPVFPPLRGDVFVGTPPLRVRPKRWALTNEEQKDEPPAASSVMDLIEPPGTTVCRDVVGVDRAVSTRVGWANG